MKTSIKLTALIIAALWIAGPLQAEVRLSKIFGDHMVLQRDKPIIVWGFAAAGEKVTVKLARGDEAQMATATADAKGLWAAELKAMKASFDPAGLVIQGKSGKVELSDVLIGELWLCGGQSNMEWTLRGSLNSDMEIESADYPAIRFYRMPHIARPEAQSDVDLDGASKTQGVWRACVAENVQDCSGVGYYFARRLHRRLKVPVGLIDTSWGGTMAQHWTCKEILKDIPEMKPYIEKFDTAMKEWNDGGAATGAKKRYQAAVKAYEKKVAAGDKKARRPNSNAFTTPAGKRQPAGMFNAMIHPIKRMKIRGVLFYQGEN
ncbi:MAG: sialate O-acetylesterase, partial [Phycisphaerae bacterium]|nr:sialate O-acetylesterase [Phycisphaerae bacterium]